MKRQELEKRMKQQGVTQIDLIINQADKLAIYCKIVGGVLKDYTGHAINRKIDLWGFLEWKDGKSTRRAFEQ